MAGGIHDGRAEVATVASLGGGNADEAFVFRLHDADCKLAFTVCNHRRTQCTETANAWTRDAETSSPTSSCASDDVPRIGFARDAQGLRVRIGDDPAASSSLFPL